MAAVQIGPLGQANGAWKLAPYGDGQYGADESCYNLESAPSTDPLVSIWYIQRSVGCRKPVHSIRLIIRLMGVDVNSYRSNDVDSKKLELL